MAMINFSRNVVITQPRKSNNDTRPSINPLKTKLPSNDYASPFEFSTVENGLCLIICESHEHDSNVSDFDNHAVS